MRVKKRFIAGAKCPVCQAVDRVALLSLAGAPDWIECVDCGHREERPAQGAQSVTELATDASKVVEVSAGIVKFRPT